MTLPPGIYARNRGVVTARYALMPPEGVLGSALPGFRDTVARILTAPAMGAKFAQLLLEIAPGGGTTAARDDGLEHVFYLLGGAIELTIGDTPHALAPHGYAYVPPWQPYAIRATGAAPTRLMWIKRPYEPIDAPAPAPIIGRRQEAERQERSDEPGRYWLRLLPTDDLTFDMHVNILAFEPGVYFPYVETHIMEHGLYMLEGQGIYMLAGDQHEAQPRDFIWMAPFCPQFFFCTGWGEAAYLLYKDVNRDVAFR